MVVRKQEQKYEHYIKLCQSDEAKENNVVPNITAQHITRNK